MVRSKPSTLLMLRVTDGSSSVYEIGSPQLPSGCHMQSSHLDPQVNRLEPLIESWDRVRAGGPRCRKTGLWVTCSRLPPAGEITENPTLLAIGAEGDFRVAKRSLPRSPKACED
jgi:hypothetical protein